MVADDNVVVLDGPTRLDIPPERVLNGALESELESVLVVGWQKNGQLYKASSTGDAAAILLLLEHMRFDIMQQLTDLDG